jgi:SnoaL-like protein
MPSPTEVVLGVFSAVEERDREKLFALCHDDVEFHDAPSLPYGGTTRGKAALWDRLTKSPETTWIGTWDPLQPTEAERRMHPRVVATAGEEVAVLYTQRCQRPSVSPRRRPSDLPNGGRSSSPLVAIGSPHYVGCAAVVAEPSA